MAPGLFWLLGLVLLLLLYLCMGKVQAACCSGGKTICDLAITQFTDWGNLLNERYLKR